MRSWKADSRLRNGNGGSLELRGLRFRLPLHFADKTISAAGQSFNEAGIAGRVAQRFSDLVHRRVQAVIEVNEGVSRPELFAEFLASHDSAGAFQQNSEHCERLFLDSEACAVLAKFARDQVRLKHTEARNSRFARSLRKRRGHAR